MGLCLYMPTRSSEDIKQGQSSVSVYQSLKKIVLYGPDLVILIKSCTIVVVLNIFFNYSLLCLLEQVQKTNP